MSRQGQQIVVGPVKAIEPTVAVLNPPATPQPEPGVADLYAVAAKFLSVVPAHAEPIAPVLLPPTQFAF